MDKLFDTEIIDTRLQHMLQRHIKEHHANDPLLKKTLLCGSQIMPNTNAAFLVTNNEKARFYGLACCHSSWGCPRCTAKRMAQYSTSIACAIDALKTQYDESGIMFTFTIPHFKWMKATDSFEILLKTWRTFSKNTGRIATTHKYTLKTDKKGKKGTIVEYNKHYKNPFANMRHNLDIKHSVRVYEFTWGARFGWHPHIHALFWLPTDKLDQVLEWEDKLTEQWLTIAKRETLKLLNKRYPDRTDTNTVITDNIYREYRLQPKTGHRSVYISKKDGKPLVAKSSHYICGWGADREIANELKLKRALPEHYSPRQLLEQAYISETKEQKIMFLELYIEYLKTTFGHRRVQFSIRSGLTAIIKAWTNSEHWFQVYKKKFTDKATDNKPWKVVCWFNKNTWAAICCKPELKIQMLMLAVQPDARTTIQNLLLNHKIKLPKKRHPLESFIENQIFENKRHNVA